jgi:hypothetical protein
MRAMNDETIERFMPKRWLEPDERMKVFWKTRPDSGTVVPASADDWLSGMSALISPPVPPPIINLFEQARACAAYGYFFYPLYSLAVEQVVRVADAAMTVKCKMMSAPKSQTSRFIERVDWLARHGGMADFDAQRWHHLRAWRNELTHQTRPTILTPAMVASLLDTVARDIQALFTVDPAT